MATLADRIKQLRTEKNITQEELGKIVGVVKSTMSMYESGKSTPNDDIKKILANYFDVSIDYLMGFTDERKQYKASNPDLNKKDEKDIEKATEQFLKGLEGGAMLNGEILDEDDLELFKQAVRNGLTYAKISNKKKYTPKKYRKSENNIDE